VNARSPPVSGAGVPFDAFELHMSYDEMCDVEDQYSKEVSADGSDLPE
jgi:hypothetical protein